ncbi:hypothetical protein FI950_23960 [Salmonella enterica]|nr:hypothetical protein [Salmonella enterica]
MTLTRKELSITDANVLIIVFCSFDNNHPYNPQVSTVWRHFCRDDGNQNMSLPGVTGMVGRICRNNRCKKTDW